MNHSPGINIFWILIVNSQVKLYLPKEVCIHCTIHYFILISLTGLLPGAMQKLAYYAKYKFYKNDLLEPSIIKKSTVVQIHFLINLVSSRYLTYIKLRLCHSCMTLQMKNYLWHLRMFTRWIVIFVGFMKPDKLICCIYQGQNRDSLIDCHSINSLRYGITGISN